MLIKNKVNPIIRGNKPSLIINQFFESPSCEPKIPMPPVRRMFMKPKIEIILMFFLVKVRYKIYNWKG